MATNKNITMKQFNGTDYDTLYPKTKVEQVEGAYTQQQILSNSTKGLFGLGNDAVPNDALVVLSRFLNGLGNDYMWAKIKIQSTSQYDTSTKTNYVVNLNQSIMYSNSFHTEGWWFVLDNPTTITITSSNMTTIKGKYFAQGTNNKITTLRKADSNADIYSDGASVHVSSYTQYENPQTIVTVSNYGYVNSPNSNTYPPAVSDGYTYLPLGQLGAKANIVTGSYMGTGLYNKSNQNSLTFDFIPKFVLVARESAGESAWNIFTPLLTQGVSGSAQFLNLIRFDANTISWYSTQNPEAQLNGNGVKYTYVAIG